ncbi:hypothetical protein AMK68_04600 [candidate division KD3-62 bacterium DG_56]|uniref:AMP-dependent synthetase n=1 Tax=candidate division KD3-62 bacterium DG_56 TaxID=1704032 RepID=A0A0S7XJV2_9BACT|nr:MAG: hypothetical protein AMK68_04600 [candidate division KD3-62 bacterium DG_56]
MTTLGRVLDRSAARRADAPFLISQEGTLTYGEAAKATDRLAGWLAGMGLRRGDAMAIWMPNRPEFVIAWFAAAKVGATVVPINPALTVEEATFMCADAGVSTVVVGAEQSERGTDVCARLNTAIPVMELADLTAGGLADAQRGRALAEGVGPEDVACCLYTSGTTGRPKGALLTHGNVTWDAQACTRVLDLGPDDRFLCVLPLFHSFAQTVCVVLPALVGAGVVLLDRFTPRGVLTALAEHEVTAFPAVPSMYAGLLKVPAEARPELPALRLCISGGAALPIDVFHAFQREYGKTILEGDGPTECGPVTCVNPPDGTVKPGSVGQALPGVEIRIFDDQDRELPTGQVGEIVVRGPNVMKGYLNQPEETAVALRGGWMHTGDMGRLDDEGYLYIVDRKKEMLLVSGFNVYPREIEEALMLHTDVVQAAVVGQADALRGEVPIAFVAAAEGRTPSERDLVNHCRQRLAPYKVPRAISVLPALPLTPTAKIDKNALRAQVSAR